jgi:hypothetical protein
MTRQLQQQRGETMSTRRPLVAGLQDQTPADRSAEERFVFGDRAPAAGPSSAPAPAAPTGQRAAPKISRVPFTTRLRSDLAQALKRASLERQLQGIEPNQVQEILENALEPWLRANGYLS